MLRPSACGPSVYLGLPLPGVLYAITCVWKKTDTPKNTENDPLQKPLFRPYL